MVNDKIDLVILWVDGNDEAWLKEKNKYLGVPGDNSKNRFRDWENLHYIFRGIEKYMPWINKIFFVTWGHLPKWLNTNNTKLRVVSHAEFIPAEYLPTFNSNVIELNLHRIKDLSENFILFNDDLFVLKSLKPTDFFVNGLPKDQYIEYLKKNSSQRHNIIRKNTHEIIDKYFSKKKFIKENIGKVINSSYGINNLKTLMRINDATFGDIYNDHLSQAFLKSTFDKVWKLEREKLNIACMNKFRSNEDIGQGICKYWQLLEGNFIPSKTLGKYFFAKEDNSELIKAIKSEKYKIICINDVSTDIDFEKSKQEINAALEQIFPDKCQYEL